MSLPLNPATHRMGNTSNILYPRCKEQKESHPIFYCKLSKINLDFTSELINLKYAFNIPFKIALKTIIMGTSSQFYYGVQLNILPTLSSEILLLNWVQKKPLWRPGAPLNSIETLMYNSTNSLRLTLRQYDKYFGLPNFIAIDWKVFPILLYTLVKLVYPVTHITF